MIKQAILLAGGRATRLGPITRVTNKHLLPIYDKPMLFYGLETLKTLGIESVTIILGGNSVGDVVNLIQDGNEFGLKVTYIYQTEPKGIAHAIALAEHTITSGKFLVLLGDNIFGQLDDLKFHIQWWGESNRDNALIVSTYSNQPQNYGQAIFEINRRIPLNMTPIVYPDKIIGFVEKSEVFIHNKIVTGLYGLDYTAFDIIKKQTFSAREELEITDTLRGYIPNIWNVDYEGFWTDCGTPEGMLEADKWFYAKCHGSSVW